MNRWANKTAIVTGAGSDIGQAITFALLKDGIHVSAIDTKEGINKINAKYKKMNKIDTHMGKLEFQYYIKDIEEGIFKKDVDILINNHNAFNTDLKTSSILGIGLSLYDQFIKDAIESMRRRQVEGHIFNINSIYGHFLPTKSLDKALGEEYISLFNRHVASERAGVTLTHMVRNDVEGIKPPIRVTSISPSCLKMDIPLNESNNLMPEDVADALIYALRLKPEVEITELIIQPTGTLP